MASREEMLARVRRSLRIGLLPAGEYERAAPPASPDPAARKAAFVSELQAAGGEYYEPATPAACLETVTRLILEVEPRVLAWPDEELPLAGIGQALQAAGIRRERVPAPAGAQERRARWAALDGVKVGLTGALGGLADTGSLALLSGPGRARAASLLPEVHIALLPGARLYAGMAEFFAAHGAPALAASSNLVFITGPSRTADIEMIITRGVHGPKRLCVVLLPQ